MNNRRRLRQVIGFVFVTLILVSCAGAAIEPTVTPTIPPSVTPTITPSPTPTTPPSPTPTITPSPTPTIPPSPTPLSPGAILAAAVTAMGELESYHFEMVINMTIVSEGMSMETPINFIGDFKAPDRFRGEMTMEILGLTIETEVISIGEDTYVKNPESGEWEMSTESATPFSPEDFVGLEEDDIANMTDLTLLGETILDDVPVYQLESILSADVMETLLGDVGGDNKIVYWIGMEDGWIRQAKVDMELIQEGDEITEIQATIMVKFSEFNKEITIEAP